jgi:hypothetical protein
MASGLFVKLQRCLMPMSPLSLMLMLMLMHNLKALATALLHSAQPLNLHRLP